ncbi:MAG: EAL domain-containing protein [Nitrosomonas sp.]|jgi:diguanylate cyclase (GGDEF)-like protein/PAS domain S-box-containing protein|nr:EAL domain-containing protein [Nitrosomonas sp.]
MSQVVKTPINKTKARKFLSFRWKITSLSSLILFAVVLLFCVVSYWGLVTNFDSQRETEFERYGREIDSLIERLSSGLRQQAETIPFLDGMPEALLSNDKNKIRQAFNRHWPLIHFNSGIETVRLYNTSNQLIADWSSLDNHQDDQSLMLEWVESVSHREEPIRPLLCEKSCIQHTVAPLLIDGKAGGTVIMGITLTDALLAFNRVSGVDIGLLLHGNSVHTADNVADIPYWNAHIAALTKKDQNQLILKAAAEKFSPIDSLRKGVQIDLSDNHYQIKLYPINAVGGNKADLVVITDVTTAMNNIHDSIWKIAAIGLLGLALSGILMFGIFTRLLIRLKDIAFTLPLLASGQFENFRQSLAASKHVQKYSDEIDMLNVAAVQLSMQLEDLEQKATTRAKQLIEQKDELSKERDFIANLLDTAQVIVLTQNTLGRINSLNAHGEMLTHFSEKELQGSSFLQLLASNYDHQYLATCLEELNNNKRDQFRHESTIRCKDGSTRDIAWLHSRLSRNSRDDPSILSVGLDVTEYKLAQERLTWLATHDPLTDLHNRRRFSEELEQMLSRSDRYNHPGALLFFDLDRFKYINDTSGHHAGDAFLKLVAKMLSQTIRFGDITARLGGDEFAVILPEINADGAIEVAKKILNNISSLSLTYADRNHKVSASIGIALFPEHGDNVHDLLAAADLAMYQAKDTGRNAWHLFSKEDQSRERVQSLVYWKEKIEYAQANDNFILFLQPIMHIRNRRVMHYEVLLRMRNGDGLILSPAGFIKAAEQSGLIHIIDHLVLRKSIALAAAINRNKTQDFISLSINLSAHAFNDPELLSILFHELNKYEINPALLMFEITETAALENLPGARTLMKEIKELGCGFVLDDFGVGFSSFYYLRELPVDAVKIDGSFIRNLGENPDDQILVSALCSVASGFGKRITAEFVESERIMNQLRKMNIDYAQGYHVGKPAPHQEFFPDIEII